MEILEQCMKSTQSLQQRHQNDVIGFCFFEQITYIALVVSFMTLNK